MKLAAAAIVLVLALAPLQAQERKPEKIDPPRVLVARPLGVTPGITTRVTLRGLRLDTASEVYFPELRLSARVISKGKASVPNQQDAARVGDTELITEVQLPSEVAPGPIGLVVLAPEGCSQLHRLFVDRDIPVTAKKEPNNGFREAQQLKLPATVEGQISSPLEVDVYRIDGRAGRRVVLELWAGRCGSPVDGVLTLYDSRGRQLAFSDDARGSSDPVIEVTLQTEGPYYLVVQDAHDQGGPAHAYRLSIQEFE